MSLRRVETAGQHGAVCTGSPLNHGILLRFVLSGRQGKVVVEQAADVSCSGDGCWCTGCRLRRGTLRRRSAEKQSAQEAP